VVSFQALVPPISSVKCFIPKGLFRKIVHPKELGASDAGSETRFFRSSGTIVRRWAEMIGKLGEENISHEIREMRV
jgi:hypothetical protein